MNYRKIAGWSFIALGAAVAVVAPAIIACWMGTGLPNRGGRASLPNGGRIWAYALPQDAGRRVIVCTLLIVVDRSGVPVAGCIWRKEAKGSAPVGCEHCTIEGDAYGNSTLLLDGKPVRPTNDFQLYVNDLHDNPIRLTLSRDEARRLLTMDLESTEKFWKEVVGPMRRRQRAAEKN